MFIPIPLPPLGAKYVAAVQGAVWKFVSCAHCQQRYAYLLNLEATGEDHDPLFLDGKGAAERARAHAEQNLAQKSRIVALPVPCPNCGSYQDDMSRRLKEEGSINSLQIAGGVIAALSLVPLAFGIPYVLTIVVAVVGLALLVYGYVVAFHFDPNAGDPEPRKALGRRHAVWGEQLAELVATSPPAVMRLSLSPCEVYDARSHAVQALSCEAGRPAPEKPLPFPPVLELQEVGGVTCVVFDYQTWTDNAGTLQPWLRSLVTEYGRTRIVLDFSGQDRVGTPSLACVYSLWWALTEAGGRFAMCQLNPALLEFFRCHDGDRLTFPQR